MLLQTNSAVATGTLNATSVVHLNRDILPRGLSISLDILYVLVALLGLLGNGFVFYLFGSRKVKLKPFNLLLLNLSVCDALSDLSILPYVFIDLKTLRNYSKKSADILCILTMGQMTYWVVNVAAIFTLCVISVSRYLFIKYPLKARFFNKSHASWIIIGVIWPVSLSVTVPNWLSYVFNPEYAVCQRVWPDYFNAQVYSLITSLLGFVMPAVVMIFTFVSTRRYFWQLAVSGVSTGTCAVERRRKAGRLLAALIIAFFVCWCPFFVYWVLSRTAKAIFSEGPEGDFERMRILRFVILVSLCNTVADPIIYAIKREDFKKCLESMRLKIPYLSSRSRARTHSSMVCQESHCDEHRIHIVVQ